MACSTRVSDRPDLFYKDVMTRLLQIFFPHYRKQISSLLIAFYKLSKSLILLHERFMFRMCFIRIHRSLMKNVFLNGLVLEGKAS